MKPLNRELIQSSFVGLATHSGETTYDEDREAANPTSRFSLFYHVY